MTVFDREHYLQTELDKFLIEELGCPPGEYASRMDLDALMKLKRVVAGVNNLLTMKLTMRLIDWLEENGVLSNSNAELERKFQRANKPNTNGFDLECGKVIAEVKCNVPVAGNRYGAAQRNSIIKDIQALTQGKSKTAVDVTGKLKFLAVNDSDGVRASMQALSRSSGVSTELLHEAKAFDRTDVVYVVYL